MNKIEGTTRLVCALQHARRNKSEITSGFSQLFRQHLPGLRSTSCYYRSEVKTKMTGYDSAFEQATNERAEIRIEIERLLSRGELLDKLLECLAPFVTSPKPVEASASAEPQPAAHEEQPQEQHQG